MLKDKTFYIIISLFRPAARVRPTKAAARQQSRELRTWHRTESKNHNKVTGPTWRTSRRIIGPDEQNKNEERHRRARGCIKTLPCSAVHGLTGAHVTWSPPPGSAGPTGLSPSALIPGTGFLLMLRSEPVSGASETTVILSSVFSFIFHLFITYFIILGPVTHFRMIWWIIRLLSCSFRIDSSRFWCVYSLKQHLCTCFFSTCFLLLGGGA